MPIPKSLTHLNSPPHKHEAVPGAPERPGRPLFCSGDRETAHDLPLQDHSGKVHQLKGPSLRSWI